jgi:RNA polymerase sigma factor (sigma-70 family)
VGYGRLSRSSRTLLTLLPKRLRKKVVIRRLRPNPSNSCEWTKLRDSLKEAVPIVQRMAYGDATERPRQVMADYEELPTRRSLLSRLKDSGNDESWKVFFDTYWKLIYNAARRSGLGNAEAQDVVQETVISVLKSIPQFKYDPEKGSFKNWLLQLTKRRIGDHRRQLRNDRRLIKDRVGFREPDETATVERVADPNAKGFEEVWNEEWEANVVEVALNRIKNEIDLKQFQIFDLYVMKDWKATKVARTLKVSIGVVYLAKHRVERRLKREIAKLQMKG